MMTMTMVTEGESPFKSNLSPDSVLMNFWLLSSRETYDFIHTLGLSSFVKVSFKAELKEPISPPGLLDNYSITKTFLFVKSTYVHTYQSKRYP